MQRWLAVSLLFLLPGCATAPVEAPRSKLFKDALFAPPKERIDAADVLAASPAMRRYLRVEIRDQLDGKGYQQGLFDALYRRGQLKLDYDSAITRTASEAFDARAGNCLSLVLMTAALARELGLEVRYNRVFAEDAWSRVGEFHVASSHVNVTLGRRSGDPRALFSDRDLLTIDFMQTRRGSSYRAFEIRESTVVAMFMNNRAAEALAAGRVDDAYWWARSAIAQDPAYLGAYNTLGVIYRHRGHLREAEAVLAEVLEREPANTHAMSNLALVLTDEGRAGEAAALSQRLARLEPVPPFHYFDLGMAQMRAGNYAAARDLFTREVERDASYHEFHFWLAAAHAALGDNAAARRHLALALENSTTRSDRDLYAAKLDRIR